MFYKQFFILLQQLFYTLFLKTLFRIFSSCFPVSKLSIFSEMSGNEQATPTRKNTTVPTVLRTDKKKTRQGIIGLGKIVKIIQLEVNCSPNGTLSL